MEGLAALRRKAIDKLEREIEAGLVKWVRLNGGQTIKFTPRGDVGWPDRIVFFPGGLLIWVELKRRGKTPTSMQYYRLGTLRCAGQAALWGASLTSLTDQIGEICKLNGVSLQTK